MVLKGRSRSRSTTENKKKKSKNIWMKKGSSRERGSEKVKERRQNRSSGSRSTNDCEIDESR